MTPNQFAEILTNSGYENLTTLHLKDGTGYSAEQFSHADEDRNEAHWKVVYAVGNGEKMIMAQHRFDMIGCAQYARLQQAKEDAQKLLDDNNFMLNG